MSSVLSNLKIGDYVEINDGLTHAIGKLTRYNLNWIESNSIEILHIFKRNHHFSWIYDKSEYNIGNKHIIRKIDSKAISVLFKDIK